MSPEDRIKRAWPNLTRAQQIQLEAGIMSFYTLHQATEAVMKKHRWPLILLIVMSILYACFAIIFFPNYPELIFAAGGVLGIVWAAIFINWAYSGGRK